MQFGGRPVTRCSALTNSSFVEKILRSVKQHTQCRAYLANLKRTLESQVAPAGRCCPNAV